VASERSASSTSAHEARPLDLEPLREVALAHAGVLADEEQRVGLGGGEAEARELAIVGAAERLPHGAEQRDERGGKLRALGRGRGIAHRPAANHTWKRDGEPHRDCPGRRRCRRSADCGQGDGMAVSP